MHLRQWQSECCKSALKQFNKGRSHFLCLATPGAGKTVMAAEIAACLFDQDKIDFVLCFSPSVTVSDGFKATFSKRLNHRFDGVIGAIGSSYTYQSMSYFDDSFWQILSTNRVLVIFDEIHHCSGITVENSNSWGEEIILNIQAQAKFTLALTGTPWRSDKSPIVLSNYLGKENAIQCDYTYGLKQAVEDGVCRSPNIVLIDNEEITVTDHKNNIQVFESFRTLLDEKALSYQDIITDEKAIQYILEKGCKKLTKIRKKNPSAGGLVVASSVSHATQIIQILINKFGQSAVMVSYLQEAPLQIINSYRNDTTQWIVAIGMVSEGTDIPRLQVCCHLSRIKTELYFRQVLGRILRVNGSVDQNAWLYTFNEPKLMEYAHRIEKDLPDIPVIINETFRRGTDNNIDPAFSHNKLTNEIALSIAVNSEDHSISSFLANSEEINTLNGQNSLLRSFEILGAFREQVVATFNSPFQS
jgi:superfamily II DNA or RNA helicase